MSNKIPEYINTAFNEYQNEMKKLQILVKTSREYLLSAAHPSNKKIPYLHLSVVSLFLRQAIELIIFSSLVVNRSEYSKNEDLSSWNINKVIKEIEKINSNWFHRAIEEVEVDFDKKDLDEIKKMNIQLHPDQNKKIIWKDKKNVINKNDLVSHYTYLSNFIHYENLLKINPKKWNSDNFIKYTLLKLNKISVDIMELTNKHIVYLPDEDWIFFINVTNTLVNGNIFERKKIIN